MPQRAAIGATFRNPDLANTLERLGAEGVHDFYDGVLAEEIVRAVQDAVNPATKRRGVMSREDLRRYRCNRESERARERKQHLIVHAGANKHQLFLRAFLGRNGIVVVVKDWSRASPCQRAARALQSDSCCCTRARQLYSLHPVTALGCSRGVCYENTLWAAVRWGLQVYHMAGSLGARVAPYICYSARISKTRTGF